MKKLIGFLKILAVLLILQPAAAFALERQPQIRSEVMMKAGDKLHLFHSGTADVRKEICLQDVLPVYRERMTGGHTTIKEVGKVKVLNYVGDHYFEAQVVEGEVKVGDVAKKATASCLIQPAQ